jgi:hypothetical protein
MHGSDLGSNLGSFLIQSKKADKLLFKFLKIGINVMKILKLQKKNKTTKIYSHFNSKSTYAVYCMEKNIIFYNLDYDKTRCGFIHLLKDD